MPPHAHFATDRALAPLKDGHWCSTIDQSLFDEGAIMVIQHDPLPILYSVFGFCENYAREPENSANRAVPPHTPLPHEYERDWLWGALLTGSVGFILRHVVSTIW